MFTRRFLLVSAGAAAIIPTGVMAQTPPIAPVFYDRSRIRLDFPSVIDGPKLPRGDDDGLPIGPKTVAAIERGELLGAGRRELTFFLWGTTGAFTVNNIVVFDQAMPRSSMKVVPVTEIPAANAPKFEAVYAVQGVPRVFTCTYEGSMVSLGLPRNLIGKGVYFLACPKGPVVYPRRAVSEGDGLWVTPPDMDRWANQRNPDGSPKSTHVTMRPLVFPRV